MRAVIEHGHRNLSAEHHPVNQRVGGNGRQRRRNARTYVKILVVERLRRQVIHFRNDRAEVFNSGAVRSARRGQREITPAAVGDRLWNGRVEQRLRQEVSVGGMDVQTVNGENVVTGDEPLRGVVERERFEFPTSAIWPRAGGGGIPCQVGRLEFYRRAEKTSVAAIRRG